GLTELDDALASGRPIVMTETEYVDIDLNGEGVGRTVPVGDVEGWRVALEELLADRGELREMGRRARAFAESSWNSRLFADRLADVLARLARDDRTTPTPARR